MTDPISFLLLVLKASFLSSGGLANLPSIHQDLVGRGLAHESQFVEAVAIGQLAPGPTGLWVVALGYLTYGFGGAALTTAAILVPPLLALPMDRLYTRLSDQPAAQGFITGLILASAGSVVAVLLGVVRVYGFDVATGPILVISALLLGSRRVPRWVVLIFSAAAGVALYR